MHLFRAAPVSRSAKRTERKAAPHDQSSGVLREFFPQLRCKNPNYTKGSCDFAPFSDAKFPASSLLPVCAAKA